jgi:hypothetical protein
MEIMATITCYRCFAQFSPRRLHFKCLQHAGDAAGQGQQGFRIFPWKPGFLQNRPPRHALCGDCRRYSSLRVCPSCREELPHYAGRIGQRIIAVTGNQGSGKTVYHWGIVHQLRERLAADPKTPVAAMFEDDESFRLFQSLDTSIRHKRTVPALTQGNETRRGRFKPMIVRLMLNRFWRSAMHTNLIFYDTAGELIHSLKEVEYLRYLAHASAIIYLVDPVDPTGAREGLNAVVKQVRQELSLPSGRKINKPLAIGISKSDVRLFPEVIKRFGRSSVLPDNDHGPGFWQGAASKRAAKISATSDVCRTFLTQELEQHPVVALAENSFDTVRYFGLSVFNGSLDSQNRVTQPPSPLGVEHPLFWLLDQLH